MRSQSEYFEKIPVLNPKKIKDNFNSAHIFILVSYAIEPIFLRLKKMNYSNIYNCISLFENTDYSESNFNDMNIYEISRRIELYKEECKSSSKNKSHSLEIKYIDIVITEACSMKCKSCSNLMQYYLKPKNVDLNLLYTSLDKLMSVTSELYEFRLLEESLLLTKKLVKLSINYLATNKQKIL